MFGDLKIFSLSHNPPNLPTSLDCSVLRYLVESEKGEGIAKKKAEIPYEGDRPELNLSKENEQRWADETTR